MSKHYGYFDDWRHARLRCAACGWEGSLDPDTLGLYNELQDFGCPGCGEILAVIPHPTSDETRRAAARGNPEALKMLACLAAQEERHARFTASKLSRPAQLPDLEGDSLEFIWDFKEESDEVWITIRLLDRTLWEELAHWEDWRRFNEVKDLLRERYGRQFRSMKPTRAADLYLFGDDIGSIEKIEYS